MGLKKLFKKLAPIAGAVFGIPIGGGGGGSGQVPYAPQYTPYQAWGEDEAVTKQLLDAYRRDAGGTPEADAEIERQVGADFDQEYGKVRGDLMRRGLYDSGQHGVWASKLADQRAAALTGAKREYRQDALAKLADLQKQQESARQGRYALQTGQYASSFGNQMSAYNAQQAASERQRADLSDVAASKIGQAGRSVFKKYVRPVFRKIVGIHTTRA